MEETVFTGTTHIGVVLDKSGSMGRVRRETIDGFNAWLADQQKLPDRALLTLALFDTTYAVPVVGSPLAQVNPLDESRYKPSGSTALLDAADRTITELEERGNQQADRYVLVIITDGEENASRETTKERLQARIAEREARGNWTFTYLSAGMDAFADAAALGIRADNTQAYTGDQIGTTAAFLSASGATKGLRMSASLSSGSFYGGQRHAEGAAPRPRPTQATPPPPPPAPAGTDWTTSPPSLAATPTPWTSDNT